MCVYFHAFFVRLLILPKGRREQMESTLWGTHQLHYARVDVTQRRGITIAEEYVSPCSERRSAELSDTLRNVTLRYEYVIFDDHYRFLMLAHFSDCVKKAAF